MHFENLINLFFVSFIFNQDMPTFTNIKSNFIIFNFLFFGEKVIFGGAKKFWGSRSSPRPKN